MNRVGMSKLRRSPLKSSELAGSRFTGGSCHDGRSEHGAVGDAGDSRDRGQLQIRSPGGAMRMELASQGIREWEVEDEGSRRKG